jgi:hypothetical protein
VNLAQAQRALSPQPLDDPIFMPGDGLSLGTRIRQWSRLDGLRDLVHFCFGRLAITRQTELLGHRDVARDRIAVDARLSGDLPVAVPRQPAT